MTESELYKELGKLTKNKAEWKFHISEVAALLKSDSTKIQAKALWLLGEMGLKYPAKIGGYIPSIANFLDNSDPLLRERALNALGRIGRADFELIRPYWKALFRFAKDEAPNVRLNFIWASENIATNNPDPYAEFMNVFTELLGDRVDKVRMEAPEIFRVIGKRRPAYVKAFLPRLQELSENDTNRVVRIHSLGAIKATEGKQSL